MDVWSLERSKPVRMTPALRAGNGVSRVLPPYPCAPRTVVRTIRLLTKPIVHLSLHRCIRSPGAWIRSTGAPATNFKIPRTTQYARSRVKALFVRCCQGKGCDWGRRKHAHVAPIAPTAVCDTTRCRRMWWLVRPAIAASCYMT